MQQQHLKLLRLRRFRGPLAADAARDDSFAVWVGNDGEVLKKDTHAIFSSFSVNSHHQLVETSNHEIPGDLAIQLIIRQYRIVERDGQQEGSTLRETKHERSIPGPRLQQHTFLEHRPREPIGSSWKRRQLDSPRPSCCCDPMPCCYWQYTIMCKLL